VATPLSTTDVAGLVQKAYAKDPKRPALFSKFPLYSFFNKVGNRGGESWNMSVLYAAAPRVGSSTADVYGLTENAPAAQYSLTPKRMYGFTAIDGLAMAQCGIGMEKKQLASFINAVHAQNMIVASTMAKLAALYLPRAGTGSLGQIDSTTTIASTTLILAKRSDQYNFEEGQVIELTATDGGAARAGNCTISRVPGDGTLILTANISAGVAAAAVGDYIVLVGEDGTQTYPGLKYWCPFAASKGTIAGVNANLAPRKLAGFFVDASAEGLTIDAGISALLSRFKANEGTASHGFLNPLDYEALAQSGSTAVVVDQGGKREFGFRSLEFVFDGSNIRFYEDSTIPMGEAWIIDMQAWELGFVTHTEPQIDNRDGLSLRKRGTSGEDAWELTFSMYPIGVCIKDGLPPGRHLAGCKLYA
jgi:hypothetical protein